MQSNRSIEYFRCRHAKQQADWYIMADSSKNCYNFSDNLKFCHFKDYLVAKVLLILEQFGYNTVLQTLEFRHYGPVCDVL